MLRYLQWRVVSSRGQRGCTARAAHRGVVPLFYGSSELQGPLDWRPWVHSCNRVWLPPLGAAAVAAVQGMPLPGIAASSDWLRLEGTQLCSQSGRQPDLRAGADSRTCCWAGRRAWTGTGAGAGAEGWEAQVLQRAGHSLQDGEWGLQGDAQEEPGQAQGPLHHPHRRR